MEAYKGFQLYEVVSIRPGKLGEAFDGKDGQIIGFVTLPDFDGSEVVYIKLDMAEEISGHYPPKSVSHGELLVHRSFISKYQESAPRTSKPPKPPKPKSLDEVLSRIKQRSAR